MQDFSIWKGQHDFTYLLTYLFRGNFIYDVKLSTQEAHPGSWQYVYFGYNCEIFLNRAEGTVQ